MVNESFSPTAIAKVIEENSRLRSKISALEAQCYAFTTALEALTSTLSPNINDDDRRRRLSNAAQIAENTPEDRRARLTASLLRQLATACSSTDSVPVAIAHASTPATDDNTQPYDAAVSPWLESFGGYLDRGIPSSYRIWQMGQRFQAAGNEQAAKRCVQLNYLLHNSSIPNTVAIGENTSFGYGGIGVVLHAAAEIGKGVVIGVNTTLGGKTNTSSRTTDNPGSRYVPKIEDYVYLATGCKILGGVRVGTLSIIGANSVVINDIPPFSVAAGSPAVVRRQITPENCLQYRTHFPALKHMTKQEYIDLFSRNSLG